MYWLPRPRMCQGITQGMFVRGTSDNFIAFVASLAVINSKDNHDLLQT